MAIDLAMVKLFNKPYDKGGRTALSGIPRIGLVSRTLRRKFFMMSPPKSTGREQFGQGFVDKICEKLRNVPGQDVVSTITEITVRGIADFLNRFAKTVDEIYLCGGGAKNDYIVSRLKQLFPRREIETTAALGYDPDYVEAVLWAYLAYRFVIKKPIDTSGFTGASRPYIPGRLCFS
jgi:anhydro-N-acetylmuramic acid kinase